MEKWRRKGKMIGFKSSQIHWRVYGTRPWQITREAARSSDNKKVPTYSVHDSPQRAVPSDVLSAHPRLYIHKAAVFHGFERLVASLSTGSMVASPQPSDTR